MVTGRCWIDRLNKGELFSGVVWTVGGPVGRWNATRLSEVGLGARWKLVDECWPFLTIVLSIFQGAEKRVEITVIFVVVERGTVERRIIVFKITCADRLWVIGEAFFGASLRIVLIIWKGKWMVIRFSQFFVGQFWARLKAWSVSSTERRKRESLEFKNCYYSYSIRLHCESGRDKVSHRIYRIISLQ